MPQPVSNPKYKKSIKIIPESQISELMRNTLQIQSSGHIHKIKYLKNLGYKVPTSNSPQLLIQISNIFCNFT